MAMSEETKRKLAEGRAAARARREQGDNPATTLEVTEYKSYTIEIEQPDRVMAVKETTVRAQWYGDIDECIEKAKAYIDERDRS